MNEYTPAPVHINSSWVNLDSRPFTHIPLPIHKQNLLTWSLEYDHYLAPLFQLPEPPSPPQCMIAIASNWFPSYPPRYTSLRLKGMSLFKMALQHPIITHGRAPPFHHCENCPRPPHCSHISLLPVFLSSLLFLEYTRHVPAIESLEYPPLWIHKLFCSLSTSGLCLYAVILGRTQST